MTNSNISSSWKKMQFHKAVKRLQCKACKIKKEDYQKKGDIPVVDQGKSLIIGYTDKAEFKFKGPYPVIIFGDHTRNVKYIDFPFAVGADGVVLLHPTKDIFPKYFYYWLKHVPLKNLGYSRHYKILTDLEISVPSLDEQHRIVSRIDKLIQHDEEINKLRKKQELELESLLHSIYYEMIQNVQWESLKKIATLIRRKIHVIPSGNYEEMGIRSFGKGTFKKPTLTGEQIGNKQIYQIAKGDLVFNNVFAWEGAVAVAQAEDEGRVGSHRFITYKPIGKKATAEFLCYHFLSQIGLETLGNASPGSAGRNRTLGLEKLAEIKVPVPPFEKQVLFSHLVNRKTEITKLSEEIKKELQILIRATLAKAFRGEL
jgi:restriction endonuclease S subunit